MKKRSIEVANNRLTEIEPLIPSLAAMLKKRGIPKGMVYEKYILQCPDGYKHSSFLEKLNRFMQVGKPTMKMYTELLTAYDEIFNNNRSIPFY